MSPTPKIAPELAPMVMAIEDLKPAENNPRRGDVAVIIESLRANGQFKPIIANRRDNTILAGNHTWAAARELGWSEIAVAWVDVDEVQATRIMLVDNRASDMASYDDFALLDLLRDVGDLDGTGYDRSYLQNLEVTLEPGLLLDESPPAPTDAPSVPPPAPGEACFIKLPTTTIPIGRESLVEFVHRWKKERDAKDQIRSLLGFPMGSPPASRALSKPGRVLRVDQTESVGVETLTVPINSVEPHPRNPRQGDTGAICESLSVNGQFRPIVVNKRDNTILAGNHTWFAARALGWSEIAVTWVDVDEATAWRILLIDNRASDVGAYDAEALRVLLEEAPTLEGTGFTFEDLDDLLASRAERANVRPARLAELSIVCEPERYTLRMKCDWDAYDAWWSDVAQEAEFAGRRASSVVVGRLDLTEARDLGTATPESIEVRLGDHSDVAPWMAVAAREHVSATNTTGTDWVVGCTAQGEVVGFAGVLRHGRKGRYARVKGVWLRPEFRGNGHGEAITDYAITHAASLDGVERLDAIAINPAFYVARGWTVGSTAPSGGTRVTLAINKEED